MNAHEGNISIDTKLNTFVVKRICYFLFVVLSGGFRVGLSCDRINQHILQSQSNSINNLSNHSTKLKFVAIVRTQNQPTNAKARFNW